MSAGAFGNLAAADIKDDQIYVALIRKFELKETSETASQYQDYGTLKAGSKITIKPVSAKASGKRPKQMGFEVSIEGALIVTGSNVRTSIAAVIGNAPDFRITDENSHKWSFTASELGVEVGEGVEGDAENSVEYPISAGGYLTKARFLSVKAYS